MLQAHLFAATLKPCAPAREMTPAQDFHAERLTFVMSGLTLRASKTDQDDDEDRRRSENCSRCRRLAVDAPVRLGVSATPSGHATGRCNPWHPDACACQPRKAVRDTFRGFKGCSSRGRRRHAGERLDETWSSQLLAGAPRRLNDTSWELSITVYKRRAPCFCLR